MQRRWKQAAGWLLGIAAVVLVMSHYTRAGEKVWPNLEEPLNESMIEAIYMDTMKSLLEPMERLRELEESGTCRKPMSITFLKTHKCASSTVQNILMRYGLKHNLNFALPATGNYFGRYQPFHPMMLADTAWQKVGMNYDIFCVHTIWNRTSVDEVMGLGTLRFTIIRDPLDLFVSLWDYASMHKYYNMDLETFALAPKVGKLSTRAWGNLGRNQMLFDFGLAHEHMDNEDEIEAKITEVFDDFTLRVLSADHFDVSMIILRDLYCMETSDVAYLKLNSRKPSAKTKLSEKAKEALREYLKGDYELYNFFIDDYKNAEADEYYRTEVGKLHAEIRKIQERCAVTPVDNDELEGEEKLWGKNMIGYTAANKYEHPDCRFYTMSENSFLDHLRGVQRKKAFQIAREKNIKLEEGVTLRDAAKHKEL